MAAVGGARRPEPATADAAPMVELRAVSKRFGTSVAVDRVGFALGRGRFLTILGPSGSGKTTLLRMIAGFIAPDEGEIVIHGQPVGDVPPYRRSIGMVFQRLALFPHMTAAQNVAYPLRMRRFDSRTIPGEVERYLELVRLGGLGGRRIQELSGGQQQRVAIARALVFRPDLLLLDEPLASLDRRLREDMQLEFRCIQRELGVTTINVTHDQREALVMSDEVLVMSEGRLQQHGSPEAAYRAPANRFVAGFIGVTNFLAGRVVAVSAQRLRLRVVAAELVGARPAAPPALGAEVACAVRAEQVRIGADAEAVAGLDNVLRARGLEAIFEGDRTVYTVAPEVMPDARLRVFDHDPLQERAAPVGAIVHVGWNARDLMVFD